MTFSEGTDTSPGYSFRSTCGRQTFSGTHKPDDGALEFSGRGWPRVAVCPAVHSGSRLCSLNRRLTVVICSLGWTRTNDLQLIILLL